MRGARRSQRGMCRPCAQAGGKTRRWIVTRRVHKAGKASGRRNVTSRGSGVLVKAEKAGVGDVRAAAAETSITKVKRRVHKLARRVSGVK